MFIDRYKGTDIGTDDKKKYAIPNFIIRTEIIYFLEKEKLDQFILGNSIKPIFISTEIPLYPFTNKSSMAHVGINVFFFFIL
jgi:hypothetical protein